MKKLLLLATSLFLTSLATICCNQNAFASNKNPLLKSSAKHVKMPKYAFRIKVSAATGPVSGNAVLRNVSGCTKMVALGGMVSIQPPFSLTTPPAFLDLFLGANAPGVPVSFKIKWKPNADIIIGVPLGGIPILLGPTADSVGTDVVFHKTDNEGNLNINYYVGYVPSYSGLNDSQAGAFTKNITIRDGRTSEVIGTIPVSGNLKRPVTVNGELIAFKAYNGSPSAAQQIKVAVAAPNISVMDFYTSTGFELGLKDEGGITRFGNQARLVGANYQIIGSGTVKYSMPRTDSLVYIRMKGDGIGDKTGTLSFTTRNDRQQDYTRNIPLNGSVIDNPISAYVDTAAIKTPTQTRWTFNVSMLEGTANSYTVTPGARAMPGFTAESGNLQQRLYPNGSPMPDSFTGTINVPANSLGAYDFNIRLKNSATGDSSEVHSFIGYSRGLQNASTLTNITYTPGDPTPGPMVPFTFTAKGLKSNFAWIAPTSNENAQLLFYITPTDPPVSFIKGLPGTNNQVGPITIYLRAQGNKIGEFPGSIEMYDGVPIPANMIATIPFTFKSIAPVASHHLTFSNTTATSTNVSWTNGNGARRAVFVKLTNNGVAAAKDSVTYTAGNFAAGTQIGTTGWYCVYNGTGNSTTVNGLSGSATYRVTVVDYNGPAGAERYVKNGLAPANFNTPADPAAAPTQSAYRVLFSNTTANSTTINWTNGNGSARAVFIANTNNGLAAPVANTTYTANTGFAAGTQVGSTGWYCIYNGTGSSVNVTGLTGNQTYRVTVVEYNGTSGAQKYISTGLAPASVVTPADPLAAPTQASYRLTFTNVASTTATVSWTNGNGANRAVFIAQTNFGVAAPVNNTTYTPNTVFGSGNQIGSTGWYCVYTGNGSSVNLTGLTAGGTYRITVVDYNGINGAQKYLASGLAPANVTTTGIIAPNQASYRLTFTNTTATSTTLSWTNGTGAARAVFVKQTNNGYAQAVNNTTYTANSSFGAGTQIGSTGWYCVYVGTGNSTTISGLNATTLYRFTVADYNGSAGSQQYITTGLAPAMVFTGSNSSGGSFRTNSIATASNLSDSTAPVIEAANILSPNGDGKNDTWIVKNIEAYPNSTVAVYTKDGRQIFQEKGYYNEWNGGGSLTKGTYYYTIDLGNGEVQKGYITVL